MARCASSAVSTARARKSPPARISQDDDVAQFISRIERTDDAFQRGLSRAKVRQLINFYETAVTQPAIPGTVLLYTSEKLQFRSDGDGAAATSPTRAPSS